MLVYYSQHVAIIEWTSNPVSDMFADATLAAILHAQTNPVPDKSGFINISFLIKSVLSIHECFYQSRSLLCMIKESAKEVQNRSPGEFINVYKCYLFSFCTFFSV